jgi:hypothetical protein
VSIRSVLNFIAVSSLPSRQALLPGGSKVTLFS